MQEDRLYLNWQNLARQGKPVATGLGWLQVLQAGRLNRSRGPDFLSARFLLNGITYQGDVEFHLKAQDWYAHQHHLDRAFANVLLHVVGEAPDGKPEPVRHRLAGREIPTIVLPAAQKEGPLRVCPVKRPAISVLQELALQRLRLKIQAFRKRLARQNPAQLFYEAFFRVLGYPNNGEVFEQLARRVNYAWLLQWSKRIWLNTDHILAVYSGQAGLLPTQPSDDYSKVLLLIYQRWRDLLPYAPLSAGQWQLAACRPQNHPQFRLAAWSFLIGRGRQWPWPLLSALLRQRIPYPRLYGQIKSGLALSCSAYWQRHYALGRTLKKQKFRRFLGAGRLNEIIINAVVPFFSALALQEGSEGFYEYLQAFYLWLPLAGGYAALQKIFPWLSIAAAKWPAQALYQAALQLQQNRCQWANCAACPLSGPASV